MNEKHDDKKDKHGQEKMTNKPERNHQIYDDNKGQIIYKNMSTLSRKNQQR